MFQILYIRQLQEYIFSLRFYIAFVLTLIVFLTGSAGFVNSIEQAKANYTEYESAWQQQLAERAENISLLATSRTEYRFSPRDNSIIADCKESVIPDAFYYNAYNVFNFSSSNDSHNPLMKRAQGLSWSFVISMFLTFIALLFAYDGISGEKESKTLSLVFSNRVSRGIFILSKLASIVTVIMLMVVCGVILSLIILVTSGKVLIDTVFLIEVVDFLVISFLLICVFSVFGLLSSVVTRHSNISLLVCLCFWLLSAVVIPNTSIFWANKLFKIPTAYEVNRIIEEGKWDINRNAPEGSWSSNSGNPFFPRHELRARNQTNLMEFEKQQKDGYYNQMFRQFENTRYLTLLSPIAQFDYMNEAFQGGGYLRFRKNWDDLHIFQQQFLQWFKDKDAKDPKSPHWYNPYETYSTSKESVEVSEIPQYREVFASFSERIGFISGYTVTMFIMIVVLLLLCFYNFGKYDIR